MNVLKYLLCISLGIIPSVIYADDASSNFMIINDISSRQNVDLWARMRADFQLMHPQNDRVKYYEKLYTKNPKNFNKMMRNARPYLYYFLDEVERLGLPAELVLIPGVESTFDPLAKNPGDAYAGMWQFEPATANRFHLTQNGDVDERRDIVKSTDAAFNYLAYLHRVFMQWEPAIGAYNWGEGNLYKAVINSGQPLGHVDYSDLDLRPITADYVPKVIALASIIENPSKFGVTLDDMPDQPYFAIVNPAPDSTISDMVKLSQTDSQTFVKLNPQFKDDDYELSRLSLVLLPLANQNIYYASIGKSNLVANTIQLAANNLPDTTDQNLKQVSLVTLTAVESSNENVAAGANDDMDAIGEIIDNKQSVAISQNKKESADDILALLDTKPKPKTSNPEKALDSLLNTLTSNDASIPASNISSSGVKTIIVKVNDTPVDNQ